MKVLVIDLPRKIWRPKIISKYKPPLFSNDVDEGIFLFKSLGKAVICPKQWIPGHRNDIISYDPSQHDKEYSTLKINSKLAGALIPTLHNILHQYWDCFAAEGIKRIILGYEFCIDTGDATPVCCKKPNYGANEAAIMMKHIKILLHNDWVEQCEGGWGSICVLAPKPHQEGIDDIDQFVWRMCVSYRGLNKSTNPFEYPIGRWDSAIEDLGDAAGE